MSFARIVFALLLLAAPARAHEFQLAPHEYQIDPGVLLVADLLVGSRFQGMPQSHFPDRFARFEVKMGETTVPVEGRMGDIPAMNIALPQGGLAIQSRWLRLGPAAGPTPKSACTPMSWPLQTPARMICRKGFPCASCSPGRRAPKRRSSP